MGRTLTPEQEIQQLKAIIREGHEVIQDLQLCIRQAKLLVAGLLEHIQATVDREMGELSNHVQAANNQAATDLNQEVKDARRAIQKQLLITEMVLDPDTRTVSFHWPSHLFDDQIPPPHPEYLPKESTP